MITFVSILTILSLLIFITIIDVFNLKISFIEALQLTFDIHLSMGAKYTISTMCLAIVATIIIDFRRYKNKKQQ